MTTTEESVAIYWDFENIHASVMSLHFGQDWFDRQKNKKLDIRQTAVLDVPAVMQYASTLGEVVINRAYANWTNFWPYAETINKYSMDLVQLFPIGMNAKNGADIRLSLDIAEDLVAHPHIDIVLLVSGDSDFIAIAQRVRRRHKRIVGLGVEKSSNRYWQMACNEFKLYHTIVSQFGAIAERDDDDDDDDDEVAYVLAEAPPKKRSTPSRTAAAKTNRRSSAADKKATPSADDAEATPETKATAAAKTEAVGSDNGRAEAGKGDNETPLSDADKTRAAIRNAPEKRLLVKAVQSLEAREGKPWIARAKVKPMMLRLDPAFDEANYDYSNFTAFLEGNQDIVELKSSDSDTLVRVRSRRRNRRGGARRSGAAKPEQESKE